jgi:signal transduction histidine kinase
MAEPDRSFAHLVSLACHDLRTPLATVAGFAKTLTRMEGLDEQIVRYLGMIDAASEQLAGLLDDLGLASRIERGAWEPLVRELDSLQLAHAAAAMLGEEVSVTGTGAQVAVAEESGWALAAISRCALRHGGAGRLVLRADGPSITLDPVSTEAGPICLGDDLRDLGAAVAVRAVGALGGTVELEGETLIVRLPLAPVVG